MISVIATVLNEGENIRHLLDSLAQQTHKPDEIVIVDGGSRDQTVTILQQYAADLSLRVITEPGCNISQGRNRAISEARGDIIASTDAGVVLAPNWLQALTTPLLNDSTLEVVSGFFHADPHTIFEAAMGAAVLPVASDVNPVTFLPSSRSIAFRKTAWQRIGGYPEWLDYCEDLIFDLRLRQSGPAFAFAPEAIAHFRPRGSLKSYFRQYYLYARGDGKADLWRKRHAIRYLTYFVATPSLLFAGIILHPAFWIVFIPGAVLYFATPYRRLPISVRRLPRVTVMDWLYALWLIPVIRVVGDIAKMLGYPVGLRWRQIHTPPDWHKH